MEKNPQDTHHQLKEVDDWIKTLGPKNDPIETAKKKIRHSQSVQRRADLAMRKDMQRNRVSTSVMVGVKASINRRSNDPHIHAREKARNLRNGKVARQS